MEPRIDPADAATETLAGAGGAGEGASEQGASRQGASEQVPSSQGDSDPRASGEGASDPAAPDGTVSGEAVPDEAVSDEAAAQLDALRAELDALNDRHLRLAAEFDNFRKRNERERTELWTRAQADLVTRLLDVLDDLQRVTAYDAEETAAAALLEGFQLVEKKYRRILESAGLEPIEASGQFFNPATMEALMTVPAERPEDDDLVADVYQTGYRFKDVLIRPARVGVRKFES